MEDWEERDDIGEGERECVQRSPQGREPERSNKDTGSFMEDLCGEVDNKEGVEEADYNGR